MVEGVDVVVSVPRPPLSPQTTPRGRTWALGPDLPVRQMQLGQLAACPLRSPDGLRGHSIVPAWGKGMLQVAPSPPLSCDGPHVCHPVGRTGRARRLAISLPPLLPSGSLAGNIMSSGVVAGGRQVEGVSSLLGVDHLRPVGTRHSSARLFYRAVAHSSFYGGSEHKTSYTWH